MLGKTKVAIGLGSNLGDRRLNLQNAVWRLAEDGLAFTVSSSVYETAPWGIIDQPAFLNAVIIGETDWKPPALLHLLKSLEREMGRVEGVRNGPRLIDLDLLVYGDLAWESPGLQVPHLRLKERDFVLVPLAEVWPDWRHPVEKASAKSILESLARTQPLSAKVFALPLSGTTIP